VLANRLAVFSDIYGNVSALDTVMEDIDKMGRSSIICLGDKKIYH
jgi:hypothetical protein